jgi:hypothetical protein
MESVLGLQLLVLALLFVLVLAVLFFLVQSIPVFFVVCAGLLWQLWLLRWLEHTLPALYGRPGRQLRSARIHAFP